MRAGGLLLLRMVHEEQWNRLTAVFGLIQSFVHPCIHMHSHSR
jgi:hypothetical protein